MKQGILCDFLEAAQMEYFGESADYSVIKKYNDLVLSIEEHLRREICSVEDAAHSVSVLNSI